MCDESILSNVVNQRFIKFVICLLQIGSANITNFRHLLPLKTLYLDSGESVCYVVVRCVNTVLFTCCEFYPPETKYGALNHDFAELVIIGRIAFYTHKQRPNVVHDHIPIATVDRPLCL